MKNIIDAIYAEDFNAVSELLNSGISPDHDYDGVLPLVEAAGTGNNKILNLLISAGASVNLIDKVAKDHALSKACSNACSETVVELVLKGADINLRCRNGVSNALVKAASGTEPNRVFIVEYLLSKGADPQMIFYSQKKEPISNVLISSVPFALPEVIEILCKSGAKINENFLFGSALTVATREGNLPALKKLIELGADPYYRVPNDPRLREGAGMTAYEIAIFKKNEAAVHILKNLDK